MTNNQLFFALGGLLITLFGFFKYHYDEKFKNLEKHLDLKIDNAFTHIELLLRLHEAEHHKK